MNGRRIADDRGLIGRMLVIWLVVIALLGIAALDTISIVRTRLSLADTAADAVHQAASRYADNRNVAEACSVAEQVAARADRRYHVARRGCVVDPGSGEITLTLRTRASTILVGRVGPISRFARVVEKATGGPSSL
jgi:hypothetical protein